MVGKIYALVDIDVTVSIANGSFVISRYTFDDPSSDPVNIHREEYRDEAEALRLARRLADIAVKIDALRAVVWHEGEVVYSAYRIGGE